MLAWSVFSRVSTAVAGVALIVCLMSSVPVSASDAPKTQPENKKPDTFEIPGGKPDAGKPEASKPGPPKLAADVQKGLYSGKVVWLQEALKRKGITARDEMKGQVVLETATGELWPIVADWRGRAFFQDKRLRDRQVDLVCGRSPGSPYLQVLMVFTFNEEGEREFTDYWCDICSIPMYEVKDCECCQGPIRLRFQPQNLPEYILKQQKEAAEKKQAEKK
ncbi:MAG: hypothetical protein U0903_11400 [Planctomycetales bacterium]